MTFCAFLNLLSTMFLFLFRSNFPVDQSGRNFVYRRELIAHLITALDIAKVASLGVFENGQYGPLADVVYEDHLPTKLVLISQSKLSLSLTSFKGEKHPFMPLTLRARRT